MRNVRFVMAQLESGAEINDLSAMLVGLSGVSAVTAEPASRAIDVQYDPLFLHPDMVRSSIEGSGYRVTEQSGGE